MIIDAALKSAEEKAGKKFVKYLGQGFAVPEQVEAIQQVIETKRIRKYVQNVVFGWN